MQGLYDHSGLEMVVCRMLALVFAQLWLEEGMAFGWSWGEGAGGFEIPLKSAWR